MPHITKHAVQRYMERVGPADAIKARAAITEHFPCIDKAAAFGCPVVLLGNGARLILDGDIVVTVLAKVQGINRKGVGL